MGGDPAVRERARRWPSSVKARRIELACQMTRSRDMTCQLVCEVWGRLCGRSSVMHQIYTVEMLHV